MKNRPDWYGRMPKGTRYEVYDDGPSGMVITLTVAAVLVVMCTIGMAITAVLLRW